MVDMRQDISGDLENTRCPEIIKILSLGKRTGRLYLTYGAETGNIFFTDGEVIHAQCGSLTGIKAIQEIAVWNSGEYHFFVDEPADMQSINMGIDEVLTETTNHLRQMDKITSLIPSSSAVYALEAEIREKEIQLKSIQWRVLTAIDGKKSIADIAQSIDIGVSDTMKILYTLLRMGLLRDAAQQENQVVRRSIDLPKTEFVNSLNQALTKAIGPIAPYIIVEIADELKVDLLSDHTEHKALLIETLSSKIPHEKMSLKFLDAMTDWLKTEV
jgi:DNA-binding MarR family transcriptional regulator